jgi:xanthine dehydrogenase accessory factor
LSAAQDWIAAGRQVALATVVSTWGSAPRPAGSHLLIDTDGNFIGSVSGGCVEAEVITEAYEVIASGRARLLEFGVGDELAWSAGLSCGGTIKVYLEKLDWVERLAELNEERRQRRACGLVRNLETGEQRLILAREFAVDAWAQELYPRLATGQSFAIERNGAAYFFELRLPPPKLLAIGAVHITQALVPLAKLADFDLVIIDPRTGFASAERFPETTLIAEWPEVFFKSFPLDSRMGVILLTHEPRIDDEALQAALRANCFYIGALGSRKTHAKRLARMTALGFPAPVLAQIHAPIGLDIGAATPAEIAIAIMAQIIQALRQKPKLDVPELAA